MSGELFSKPKIGRLNPAKKRPKPPRGDQAGVKRAISAAVRECQWRKALEGGAT